MKKISAFIILLAITSRVCSQGIEFFHGSFEEALKKAKEEHKSIFVDCFTTWCGPCKMLSNNTFPNEQLGAFHNQKFVNIKLDMENEGASFAMQYGVRAYPTMFFLDADGNVKRKVVGYRNAEQLLVESKQAVLPDMASVRKLKERYEAGEKTVPFLQELLTGLSALNMPLEVPFRDYLQTIPNPVSDKKTAEFILETTPNVQSAGAKIIVDQKANFITLVSEGSYKKRAAAIATTSMQEATKNNDAIMQKEAKNFLKNTLDKDAKTQEYQMEMNAAEATENWAVYSKNALNYIKGIEENKAAEAEKAANKIILKTADKTALKNAQALLKLTAEKTYKNLYLQSLILVKQDKITDAKTLLGEAIELGKTKQVNTQEATQLLEKISK